MPFADPEKAKAWGRLYHKLNRTKRNTYRNKHYRENKDSYKSRARAWVKNNPGKRRTAARNFARRNAVNQHWYHIKSKYGLSKIDYDRLIERQKGLCAICKGALTKPNVDHDHLTGAVRGILCPACNIGLGGFKDSPDSLKRAICYLEKRLSIEEF